jgi:hypothetical protein
LNSKDIATIIIGIVGFFAWPFIAVWWLIVEPMMLIVRLVKGSEWGAERKARTLTNKLYKDVAAITAEFPSKLRFAHDVIEPITDCDLDALKTMVVVAAALYQQERFVEPVPKPPAVCNSIEAARYRDWLSSYAAKVGNPQAPKVAQRILTNCFRELAACIPQSTGDDLTVPLTEALDDIPELVENVCLAFFDQEAVSLGVFADIRNQLNRNPHEASGLPYTPQYYESGKLIMPTKYQGENVIYSYLKGTPLLDLFDLSIGYAIPDEARFEGQWIVGPQGTGKTQFLQYQIVKLLPQVLAGKASIIVMDSQEEMIPKLSRLKALQGRIVLIDANDVE